MIVLCSYPLVVCGATEVLDVARNHHFAIAKRAGKWEVVQWRMPSSSAERYETLTSRERDVFHLAAEGHTNPEISQRLFIGVRTVEGYRANLMRKLGLRNQTDLVRYALQGGPLPIETQTRQTRGD
jgi:DNA-binding NarL/FixJ family response regulator